MIKVIIYLVIKGLLVIAASYMLFTLIPIFLYLILLPFDVAAFWFFRTHKSIVAVVSFLLFIGSNVFSFMWISAGNGGLNFLMDWN